MGGIILVASIIIWALGYFPHNNALTDQEQKEASYIGMVGKAVEPIFEPLGFNWKLNVGIIAGIGAKEIVASTIGVLYSGDDSFAEDESVVRDDNKYNVLRSKMEQDGITQSVAVAFLVFILLYFPCIATIAAIKNEANSWRWAAFTAIYTTIVAWIAAFCTYNLMNII